jgi:eukaryotic-like serine/threonine-protein kinase
MDGGEEDSYHRLPPHRREPLETPLDHLRIALADRYVIERELGRGGMATVYLARDLRHDRPVALKVLRPELAPTMGGERFHREIKLAARLQHPNILSVHDSGEVAGQLWFTMPYVAGESLRDRLTREHQLPVADALRIAREAADALGSAHRHGVIHRDVKPENILLSEGHALLADFGVARALRGSDRLTETGIAVGTPAYMSPEQASAETEIDARSDVYSLGCVLYEMLVGHPPFLGANAPEVLRRHVLDPVPPLRTGRPDLPVDLEDAVFKALAKAPADRFSTAHAFSEALAPAAGGAPRAQRTRWWTRPLARSAAAVAVVAAVGYYLLSHRAITRGLAQSGGGEGGGGGGGGAPAQSIAVLPFVNLSPDRGDEYFSDGMSEELITALHVVPGLRVAARTSAFAFRNRNVNASEIGRDLNVATLLEGTVRRAGSRVRVSAQLINAAQGYQLWAEEYERDVKDVFAVQDEISRAIVQALQVTLRGAGDRPLVPRSTASPEAHDLYLKGRYFFWQRSEPGMLHKSAAYFEQAIAADTLYASAYSGLSDAYSVLSIWGYLAPREGFARAKAAAQRALRLDSTLAEAHTSLAIISLYYDWDWPATERELSRASALDPQYAPAHLFRSWYSIITGRVADAIPEMQRARELDPLSGIINTRLGSMLYYAHRYDDGVAQLQKTLELDSTNALTHAELARTYLQQRRCDDALVATRLVPATLPNPEAAASGFAQALCGHRAEALRLLGDLKRQARGDYVIPAKVAMLHAALGDRDSTFVWLERGYRARDAYMVFLKVEPLYDGVRGDPRFADLVRRVGLER